MDCHNQQQRPPPDPPAAAASAPPPLFPPHSSSHAPLPTVQRAAIVVLDKQGLPRTEIAQQAGTSLPTVRHWLKHYDEKKDVADKPRSGRPRCTDEATDTNTAVVGRVEQVEHEIDPQAGQTQAGSRRLSSYDPSASRRVWRVRSSRTRRAHSRRGRSPHAMIRLSFGQHGRRFSLSSSSSSWSGSISGGNSSA